MMTYAFTEDDRKSERGRAIRALLHNPLLNRAHPAFEVVVVYQDELRRWFRTTAGWDLDVDIRRGFARLWKVPGHSALPRPLLASRSKRPFDRRRYELFCVTAAAFGQFPRRQVSLQDLAPRITSLTGNEDLGLYDAESTDERKALIDVLSHLEALGVIRVLEVQGNYEREKLSNALYAIEEGPLAALLLKDSEVVEAEDASQLSLTRRLLDDPAVYHEDLDAAGRARLQESSRWFRRRLVETGLLVEQRAHGWCAIDATDEATDMRFPQLTALTHQAALLIISRLSPGDTSTSACISEHRIKHEIGRLLDEHPAWAQRYRRNDDAEAFTADVISLLRGLDLIRADDMGLEFRPAAGRFRNVGLASEDL